MCYNSWKKDAPERLPDLQPDTAVQAPGGPPPRAAFCDEETKAALLAAPADFEACL